MTAIPIFACALTASLTAGWFRDGTETSSVGVPQGCACRKSVDGDAERWTLVNTSRVEVALQRGSFGVRFPFDNCFEGKTNKLATTCISHVWCGGELAWIVSGKADGMRPRLVCELERGSVTGYGTEADMSRAKVGASYRGDIILYADDADLKPGERLELAFRWSLADDFPPTPRVSTCSPFVGETFTVEGRPHSFDTPGERVLPLVFRGKRTFVRVNVLRPFDDILFRRAKFITTDQQCLDESRPEYGAYLIRDNRTGRLVVGPSDDHNAGRERLAMGAVVAMALQRRKDEAMMRSLELHRRFVERELFDAATATVYNDVGRNNRWHRRYNYPWMAAYYLEWFRLTDDHQCLERAADIMLSYYEKLDGAAQESHVTLVPDIIDLLDRVGDAARFSRLRKAFVAHADAVLARSGKSVSREVNWANGMVSMMGIVLSRAHLMTGDVRYLDGARRICPLVEAFSGIQPDYRLNGQAVRYWDGFWFGGACAYGDTMPQWVSAQLAEFDRWYGLASKTDRSVRMEENLRGGLCVFSEMGAAAAAAYPALTMRTYVGNGGGDGWRNGSGKFVTGETLDVWANDQDWSLYYAVLYLRPKICGGEAP